MSELKKKNSNLPFVIIGVILLAAIGVGYWLATRPTTPPVANKTGVANSSNRATSTTSAEPGAIPAWVKGAENAPVMIEEFADFECPTCAEFHKILKEIKTVYGDRVKVIYRHYPLPAHKKAYDASRAAEAAGVQGKFWEMQDRLFTNQDKWKVAADHKMVFTEYAKEMGLDVDKFTTDMGAQLVVSRISDDMKRGKSINVDSTPTVLLNRNKVNFEDFIKVDALRKIIDSELQKAGSQSSTTSANSASATNSANAGKPSNATNK